MKRILGAALAAVILAWPAGATVDRFERPKMKERNFDLSSHRQDFSPHSQTKHHKPASIEYQLGKEMIVEQWVLCDPDLPPVKLQELVVARAVSFKDAEKVYRALAKKKDCRQFSKMRLILQERHFAETFPGYKFQVFSAIVYLGKWHDQPNAYVIEVGIPFQ